jgi:acetyltransferase-like isoleucine patch superfamily enzyme
MISAIKGLLRSNNYRRIGMFKCCDKKMFVPKVLFGHMVDPRTITVSVGKDSLIRGTLSFEKNEAKLFVGTNTSINNSLIALAGILTIGSNVLISYECLITDHNGHSTDPAFRRGDLSDKLNAREKDWSHVKLAPIII